MPSEEALPCVSAVFLVIFYSNFCYDNSTSKMIVKAEQERIRTLLRDTITLLCKNGLTFKTEFSIEALIGITLDKDDVVLVSINEQFRPEGIYHSQHHRRQTHHHDLTSGSDYEDRSDGDDRGQRSMDWSRGGGDGSGGEKNHRNHHRRRRRKRQHVEPKKEPRLSDGGNESTAAAVDQSQNSGLLDLSTDHRDGNEYERKRRYGGDDYYAEGRNSSYLPLDGEEAGNMAGDEDYVDGDNDSKVIVKKELCDENWPPGGVMHEVTVGGSDSGLSDQQQPPFPTAYNNSTASSSGVLPPHHVGSSGVNRSGGSPCSSPRHHPATLPPALPPLPLMNGLPFPPLQMPQSHFAQALGRLVGTMPPSTLPQMPHMTPPGKESSLINKTPIKIEPSSANSTPLYQPSSRTSLPKVAVALMTDWLRKNTHNPYPTDDVKDEFVQVTGLTFNQINYWFTNARRRLLPKWEMQRNLREQEMVQQMAQQIPGASSTPPLSGQHSSSASHGDT